MADDDQDDFMILQEAATKVAETLTISYAANWMDMWKSLMKALPHAVLLDLNMPVKDGFECLQTLRADDKFNELPIIIYSTSLNKTDIDKAYEYGANYFVVKPNSMEEITTVLKKIYSMDKAMLLDRPVREEFVIV